jgi:capsular polysaccharide transport system ATP-binding protein
MIILDEVTKAGGRKQTLTKARVSIPSNARIALLGPRPEDKRVFMNLIAGIALPDSGRIIRDVRVSFPAGHTGGFASHLPVHVNVAHVARLYGADVKSVVNFVAKISKLGNAYDKPYGDLSKVAKRTLSQLLVFSIPFDVYLLSDDVVTPLNQSNKAIRALFEARAKTSGMIIASEDQAFAREFCDMGFVLSNGEARLFDDLEQAIAFAEQAARAVKERAGNRRANKKTNATARLSEEKTPRLSEEKTARLSEEKPPRLSEEKKEKRVAKRKRRSEHKTRDR